MGCITQVSPFPISGHSNPILTELLEICYVQTSLYHADTSDCFVYFSLSLTLKPMYDTIWWIHFVRYDLAALFDPLCTISISEPRILRYLVLGGLRPLST